MSDLASRVPGGICARCFGRIFARLGSGFSNDVRGNLAIFAYSVLGRQVSLPESDNSCRICRGLFGRLGSYATAVSGELSKFEYSTFLLGSTFDESILEFEKELQDSFGGLGESIKKEFNRECGKIVSSITGKPAEFSRPDLTIHVDLRYDAIKVKSASVCISGCYRKFRRDLPQTRWIHMDKPGDSVEEIIGEPLKAMLDSGNFFLHGAGREDVDVRMLGNGRKFIIEAYEPRRRMPDTKKLESDVNGSGKGVEIFGLSVCDCSAVKDLKGENHNKTYVARISFDSPVDSGALASAVSSLTGKVIYQRTPLRVSSRRSDLVRERKIINLELLNADQNGAVVRVTAQAGTYIKEFLNGDGGRTAPSLSSQCSIGIRVVELDVMEIHRGENNDENVTRAKIRLENEADQEN